MTRNTPRFLSRTGSLAPALVTGPAFAAALSLVFCLFVVLAGLSSGRGGKNLDDFAVGKVAVEDVTADREVLYEDADATALRREALKREVPPVFQYQARVTDDCLARWREFAGLAAAAAAGPETPVADGMTDEAAGAGAWAGGAADDVDDMEKTFAGAWAVLEQAPAGERAALLDRAGAILADTLDAGVYARDGLEIAGREGLNDSGVELVRQTRDRFETEIVPLDAVVTLDGAVDALTRRGAAASGPALSRESAALAPLLAAVFVDENVFFAPAETARRVHDSLAGMEPVMKYIERGARVIRKGFVITGEDMEALRALNLAQPGSDVALAVSRILLMLLLFCFLTYYCVLGSPRPLTHPEAYLVCALSAIYLSAVTLAPAVSFGGDAIPASLLAPTALAVMLPAILICPSLALVLAVALPLGAFFSGSFDGPALIFALVSGVAAAFSLRGAENRMDLIRAGLVIAGGNCVAMTALLLGERASPGSFPQALFWAAFNGLGSGMLVLGFLPPLERVLNAATAFRLRELSDLNSPALKKLFAVAPGTYSHALMVANLAEAACQDIGANALLARVGAYYHDIGKMENPGYFTENQSGVNPHDELAPRLSATIIRSHVKLGLDKARDLGLPRQVADIIAEHHGSDVIVWFYTKAREQEEAKADGARAPVSADDFSYAGSPPRSRESAVVMLADTVEAAMRAKIKGQDRATAARLGDWIQELFDGKVERGQLAQSDLTFHDLETIKNAFIRVLLGHYHSRIDYPKLPPGEAP